MTENARHVSLFCVLGTVVMVNKWRKKMAGKSVQLTRFARKKVTRTETVAMRIGSQQGRVTQTLQHRATEHLMSKTLNK